MRTFNYLFAPIDTKAHAIRNEIKRKARVNRLIRKQNTLMYLIPALFLALTFASVLIKF